MKKLLLIICSAVSLQLWSQDIALTGNQKIEYYDGNWVRTENKSQMAYYRIIEYTSATTCKGPITYYYANGIKQSECHAIYVDPVTESQDKLDGPVYFYDTNGKLSEVDFFDQGNKITYISADLYNSAKYKPGDKIEFWAVSGDQDIWIPAEVLYIKGSDYYTIKPLLYGWGEKVDNYESNLRPVQSGTTIKLIMPSGQSEPTIEALAKKELLAIHSDAVISQIAMNGSTWEVGKDWTGTPTYRAKKGYIAYQWNGGCYTIRFQYDEPYENGAYQKKNSIKFDSETPYMCK